MKYYTAFLYGEGAGTDHQGDPLHVTHKYLGELSEPMVQRVIQTIDAFTDLSSTKLPEAVSFTDEEFFGGEGEVRVLTPKEDVQLWPELRAQLDPYRKDDYASYKPHLSTALPEVHDSFAGYGLLSNAEIVKKWTVI